MKSKMQEDRHLCLVAASFTATEAGKSRHGWDSACTQLTDASECLHLDFPIIKV